MLANRGQEIFVETSLRQEKQGGVCAQRFSAAGCFPTLGRAWTAKVLATEALVGAAKAQLGAVLESLVARRLIDLGSEWHLHRHRYEHSAWKIYLAKTMRWHPNTSYIAVLTHS